MKRLYILIVLFSAFIQSGCSKNAEEANIPEEELFANTLNIMSFNIRYSPNDGINNWGYRKKMATDVFRDYAIDIAGLQEVVDIQLPDLENLLPEYAFFGDHAGTGVYSPILYNKEKFQLLDYNTFWLSATPDIVGSMGWDARFPRTVTWGKFKNKDTGSIFFFFNTHFDHIGTVARRESAKLLMAKLGEIAGNTPAIVTGDFNFTKDDSYYDIIVSKDNTIPVKDTKVDTAIPFSGIDSSFNGFGKPQMVIIDFVFVTENIRTKIYDILNIREGDVYISDHYPVYSVVAF